MAALVVLLGLLVGCSYEGQDAQDDLGEIHRALRDADLTFDSQRCFEPEPEEFTADWRLHVEVDADGAEVAAALDGLFDVEEQNDGWRVERPRFGGFEGTISTGGTVELVARGVGGLSSTVGLVGQFPTPCGEEFPTPEPTEQPIDPYVEAGIRPIRLWAHNIAEIGVRGETDVTGKVAVADGCVVLSGDGGQHPVIWPHGTELVETIPPTIRLPDGRLVVAGSSVASTGGYTAADELPLDIPENCMDASRQVAWFNPTNHVWITRDATGP